MSSFGSADNQIHIANNTSESIYVLVAPNMDWAWADIGFNIVTTVATMGLAGPATVVNTLSALQKVATALKVILEIEETVKLGEVMYHQLQQDDFDNAQRDLDTLKAYMDANALKIPAGSAVQVDKSANWNPLKYLGPSGWGSVFGASDVTLSIITESFSRRATFNTNSDYSWIVNQNEVVRSAYGSSLWQESRGDGFYRFGKADRLAAGQFLAPGECLTSNNGDYDLIYQTDGNAVVYARNKPQGERARWSSGTNGSSTNQLVLQGDGNFVVYDAAGKPGWASGRLAQDTQVIMQDDGNLVVYGANQQPLWASQG